ncbi:MAG: hypothetical protein NTW05_17920, partial [Pseudonocardiales bacterium]|nr:hypothetical protein [Pseudonocardiales bacterium]
MRAALHARAATVVGSAEEALRHRLAAAAGDDPALAAELRAHAAEQVGRGERARGAATLIDAAGLLPDAPDRRACLVEAAELLVLSGERARATEIVAALPAGPGPAREAYVRGLVEFTAGRTAEAERLLLAAWAADDTDPGLRASICDRLCHLYYLQMRSPEAVEWGMRARAVDPRHSAPLVTSLALAGRAIPAAADRTEPAVARGARLLWTEDHAGARAELATAVTALRAAGMVVESLHAQGYLALTEHRMGEWDSAVAAADEAIALAEDAEQDWTLARLHSFAAMPHAARGDWERADAHVTAARKAATTTGLPLDRVGAMVSAAHVADARGDHAAVVELLGPLAVRGTGSVGEPGVSTWPCLLGDALVHLGRPEEADRVLTPYERRAAELGRRAAQCVAGRVRGRLHAARGDGAAAEAAL